MNVELTYWRQSNQRVAIPQIFLLLSVLISLCVAVSPVHGLGVSVHAIKRAYVFRFFQYITWEDEQTIDEFRVALVGQNEQLFDEFKKAAVQFKIRGKSISIHEVGDLRSLPRYQVVFVAQKSNALLNEIASVTRRTNTLLISDNSDQKRSFMINLIVGKEGNVTFEINKSNLVYERLKIHKDILLNGGTELDVAELLREVEDALNATKSETQQYEQALENLKVTLKQHQQEASREQLKLIRAQELQVQKFDRREGEFEAISSEFERAKESLTRTQEDLQRSQSELLLKQSSLATKEKKVFSLSELIETNSRILASQQQELKDQKMQLTQQERGLADQRAELAQQFDVIGQQRYWLGGGSVVILLFVILMMSILRINQTRLRLNRELFSSNAELEDTQVLLQETTIVAQSANQQKSLFLANMSHEIRTPMNSILGFARIVRGGANLTPKQRQNLDIVSRCGEHLLDLINDVMDMSKIESGRIELNQQAFGVLLFLEDLENLFKERCESKRLTLTFKHDAGMPQGLITDKRKLNQILINLLGNAVKFTQHGGVTLTSSFRDINETELINQGPGLSGATHLLTVEVKDTGCGIGAEEHERIFKSFEQSSNGLRAGEGSGLGLAISREYARLMGGDIIVQSALGSGSTFRVIVCCSIDHSFAKSMTDLSPIVIGLEPGQLPCRILIVDDLESNRNLLLQQLSPIGFELREASNGKDAITVFQAWRPNLILMDHRMPLMDGAEATRRIKAGAGGKDVRVIATSAGAFDGDRREIMSGGADNLIRKPVHERELLQKIGQQLDLRYLYQEEEGFFVGRGESSQLSEAQLSEAISQLPQEQINFLLETINVGDRMQLEKTINLIAVSQPLLAKVLSRLAENYDYDALSSLLS